MSGAMLRITKVMPALPLIDFLPLKPSKLILLAIPKPTDPSHGSFPCPSCYDHSKGLKTDPATPKTYQ